MSLRNGSVKSSTMRQIEKGRSGSERHDREEESDEHMLFIAMHNISPRSEQIDKMVSREKRVSNRSRDAPF